MQDIARNLINTKLWGKTISIKEQFQSHYPSIMSPQRQQAFPAAHSSTDAKCKLELHDNQFDYEKRD